MKVTTVPLSHKDGEHHLLCQVARSFRNGEYPLRRTQRILIRADDVNLVPLRLNCKLYPTSLFSGPMWRLGNVSNDAWMDEGGFAVARPLNGAFDATGGRTPFTTMRLASRQGTRRRAMECSDEHTLRGEEIWRLETTLHGVPAKI